MMTGLCNVRNGSRSDTPNLMTNHANTYQYAIIIRLDWGVTLSRRLVTSDPRNPASWSSVDLSADAIAVAGLRLPVNPVDNHWNLAIGVDKYERIHITGNQHATDTWGGRNGQNYIYSNGAWPPVWTRPAWSSLPWASLGANAHTYNTFGLMSDGALIWLMDQQDSVTDSRGRDYLGYVMPATGSPGPTAWVPLRQGTGATGEFATTRFVLPSGSEAERSYAGSLIVEPKFTGDRIWIAGNWRTVDASAESATGSWVVYTDDRVTWYNADGVAVPMPRTWQNKLDAEIPGIPAWGSLISLCVDANGHPHVIVQNGTDYGGTLTSITNSAGVVETTASSTGVADNFIHAWHNGTAWVLDRIEGQGSTPSPQFFTFRDSGDDGFYISTVGDGSATIIVDGANSHRYGYIRMANQWSTEPVKFTMQIGPPQKTPYFVNSLTLGALPDTSTSAETWSPGLDPTALRRGSAQILTPSGDVPCVDVLLEVHNHGYPVGYP